MPIYDELLGDLADQDRMARAAQKLRRREAFATLGAFTGDPYLGPWGQQTLSRLPQQAQGLARSRQEFQSHQQRLAEHQGLQRWRQQQNALAERRLDLDRERFEKTPLTPGLGPIVRPNMPGGPETLWGEGVQEALQARREHERNVAQTRANVALQNQMALQDYKEQKMSDAAQKEWRDNQDNILRMGDRLEKMIAWDKAGKQWVEPVADIPSHIAHGMGADTAAEMYAEAHKDADEMAARSWLSEDVAEKRKGLMGSAVTAYEGAKMTPWDPSAPGISQRESLRRYKELRDALFYANTVLSYGLRIPGIKRDPLAVPPKPPGMTDEEFSKFNLNLQQMMVQGRAYPGATFPTAPAAPVTPAQEELDLPPGWSIE